MIVSAGEFHLFLKKVSHGLGKFEQVIIPYSQDLADGSKSFRFKKVDENLTPVLSSYRTIDPLKILFYPTREQVFPVADSFPKRLVVGAKGCDIKAIQLLDKALLNSGFVDPSYQRLRENTIIISTDCQEIHSTCNCNLVGGKPFCDSGFDLNLSSINGKYLITIGSEKSEPLIDLMKKEITVKESSDQDKKAVEESRKNILKKLEEKNSDKSHKANYPKMRNVNLENWDSESNECVGCGACTNICPTCYCLILNDESKENKFIKVRGYDSCQWFGYARVAGGATPRPKMNERFRNRYLCKFDYMEKNFGEIGCTGCGRCTEACAAKIDFMNVVKNITQNSPELVQ